MQPAKNPHYEPLFHKALMLFMALIVVVPIFLGYEAFTATHVMTMGSIVGNALPHTSAMSSVSG